MAIPSPHHNPVLRSEAIVEVLDPRTVCVIERLDLYVFILIHQSQSRNLVHICSPAGVVVLLRSVDTLVDVGTVCIKECRYQPIGT